MFMLALSDARHVGGQEVDAVPVEVASGAVVVLGGAGVGVTGEDLRVTEWDARVEGVRDRRVAQGVRADVPRDACRPEYRARKDTAANCAGVMVAGWNGRRVVVIVHLVRRDDDARRARRKRGRHW